MGAVSFGYCKECLTKGLEPYGAMVAYISCAGHFPEDINEKTQEYVKYILSELNIPESKFIEDCEKAEKEYIEWCNQSQEEIKIKSPELNTDEVWGEEW
jgi:phosphoribosyl 1,2-cyclic phosphodiesterase